MATKLAPPEPRPASATFGGAAMPEILATEDEMQAHKRHKLEAKWQRDAERPPESFERFRILTQSVEEARKVIDLVDHRVRYALVIVGVLNAGVFFLVSRGHFLANLAPQLQPWVAGFLVAYAGLTALFVLYAIDSLRPRRLGRTGLLSDTGEPDRQGPQGLLYWETIIRYDLESYRKAWGGVRMAQLNAEAVLINYHLAKVLEAKYGALGRLYRGIAVLAILAAIQIAIYAAVGTTQ
jgi:hypothetical protein